jgi:hypothetical protein
MNQWPQQPGPPQQYPVRRRAGGGAAGTAISLGFVIGFLQALSCTGYLILGWEHVSSGTAPRGWVTGFLFAEGILRLLAAVTLIVGAVMLIRRKAIGRWVAAGAALVFVPLQFIEYAVWPSIVPSAMSGVQPLSAVIGVILPIILVVLVLTRPTRRWLDDGRRR